MPNMPISIYNTREVEQLQQALGLDSQRVRQLRNDLLKRFKADAAVVSRFPAAKQLTLHSLELVSRHDSELDGATKLLLRTDQGMLIETGRSLGCAGCRALDPLRSV